jgi:hypothetical protein
MDIETLSERVNTACYKIDQLHADYTYRRALEPLIQTAYQHLYNDANLYQDNENKEYDGSGFVRLLLTLDGAIPTVAKYTAKQLYDLFPKSKRPDLGRIAYYGKSKVHHCMFCLNGIYCIGTCGSVGSAAPGTPIWKTGRRVRVVRIHYRRDLIGYNRPLSTIS